MLKNNNKVELLSPAGNMEKLKSAFHFGADAVYIGGRAFNLRGMSSNFTNNELVKAVEYTHSLGKKIFVTLNIFAHNQEVNYIPKFIKFLEKAKVDAVIVADMGIMMQVKEYAPDLEIHISTQANNTNWVSVKTWGELGAKRIILARETSLRDIKYIRDKVPDIELEVFVHGAMCMAVSGRCLLSNYFTHRDANKGVCAQDCRWNYKVIAEGHEEEGAHDVVEDEGGTFIFNAKDLCTIDFIDRVIETGVDSLKIEGRMKSIYYNSTVTKQYREAIDAYYAGNYKYDPKWMRELQTISHRKYSRGFYLGKTTEFDQNYNTGSSYSQTYQMVANVIEKIEEGKYRLQIRNRIDLSEVEFEVLRPNVDPFSFKVDKMLNTKTGEYETIFNPNSIVILETPVEMEELDLLRVKLPVGQSDSDMDLDDLSNEPDWDEYEKNLKEIIE